MAKKGFKSLRGKAETRWGETKSAQVKAQVTPTGRSLFLEKVKELGLSLAEFIERTGRGKIKLTIVPDSLKELIEAYGLEELANDADMPIEKLQEIKDGRTPTPDERMRLSQTLTTWELT